MESIEGVGSRCYIDSSKFTTYIKSWLSIICARIVPYTHETEVMLERVVLVVASMDSIEVDFGRLIVDWIDEFTQGKEKSIIFSSLITMLCYDVVEVKYPTYEEKKLVKEINPLKEGIQGDRIKKRKIDVADPEFGQFTQTTSACSASTSAGSLQYGPATMRYLSSEIHEVREMMASIPSASSGVPTSVCVPPPRISFYLLHKRRFETGLRI
ncbi:hypothetical protein KY285_010543 [Solanum tuberosum]|nr:hypothetical protein KY289_011086 [Solanum tuberosum]KAH0734836.1 hypothetical protein KY285_010543 [Solanum tuberosum]